MNNSRTQKVAIVTNVLSSYRVPCFQELMSLSKDPVSIFILDNSLHEREYIQRGANANIQVTYLPGKSWRRQPFDDIHLNDIRPIVKGRFKIIILGGWHEPTYLILWLWALLTRRQTLFWVESTSADSSRSGWKEAAKKYLLARTWGCIVPGEASRSYCLQLGVAPERIFVAPNATNREYFKAKADELIPKRTDLRRSLELNQQTVLFVGRLVERLKGVSNLISACATLSGSEKITLVLAGDGPDRLRYEAEAKNLGVKLRVTGFLTPEKLSEYYAAADLLVLPSQSEPWGFVVNEAMEFGLPLVISQAAGCGPDLVKNGINGILVDPENVSQIADSINQILDSPNRAKEMGRASREAIQNFSPQKWANGVLGAVESCKATSSSGSSTNKNFENRRILLFNPWQPLIGPNIYLEELFNECPELAGHSIVVSPFEKTLDIYSNLGCEVEIWPEAKLIHPPRTWLGMRDLMAANTVDLVRIVHRVNRLKPSVIVTNTENMWASGIASRVLGIPHIQVYHSMLVDYRLANHPRFRNFYLKLMSQLSTFIVPVSNTLAVSLKRGGMPEKKLQVVPNSIAINPIVNSETKRFRLSPTDTAKFSDVVAGLDETIEGSPIIVSVGLFSSVKGQDILIEALPDVITEFPNLVCLLVGDEMDIDASLQGASMDLDTQRIHGEFREQLVARMEELGIDKNVRLLARYKNVRDILRMADLCVQPSRTESFGRVAAEALLEGTPVIVSDAGGMREAVGPGGWIVSTGDVPSLTQAILEVLRDCESARVRAEEGRRYVSAQFSPSECSAKFVEVLRHAGYTF